MIQGIRKWNIYFANVRFIDTNKIKERPVIVLGVYGVNVLVLPLTSSVKKTYNTDIIFNLNNVISIAKITNLQRIHIDDIKRNVMLYNKNKSSYARVSGDKKQEIQKKLNIVLFGN